MGDIVEFFRKSDFDPETVKLLCDAYDKASRSLDDNGQPDMVKEVIARRIISLAQKGERNPDRLCARALAALGDRAAS
jgi:hypothetical protein